MAGSETLRDTGALKDALRNVESANQGVKEAEEILEDTRQQKKEAVNVLALALREHVGEKFGVEGDVTAIVDVSQENFDPMVHWHDTRLPEVACVTEVGKILAVRVNREEAVVEPDEFCEQWRVFVLGNLSLQPVTEIGQQLQATE